MTMRRATTALLLALLVLTAPAAAMAGPANDGDPGAGSWLAGWLAGLEEGWQEVLGLAMASEGGTDGDSTTTPDEPTPPGGELGPLIGPDGAADEGPEPEVEG